MEDVVDLDEAVREIEQRRDQWVREGLTVGQATWRDETDEWPHELKTTRAAVVKPDSVGIRVDRGEDRTATVVLFRGGWADIDILLLDKEHISTDAPDVPNADTFGRILA